MKDDIRLDEYIKDKFKITRSRAKLLIDEDRVNVNGIVNNKASYKVKVNDVVIIEDYNYVSRAGRKLEDAYEVLRDKYKEEEKREILEINNKTALDIGSSTGGFTDYLLQNGIKEVVAVDVGQYQFNKELLRENKARVKLFENTDIRNTYNLEYFKNIKAEGGFDIIVCDVSFISLSLIIPQILEYIKNKGYGIILFKPQFEVGKSNIGKNGIVNSEEVVDQTIKERVKEFENNNLSVIDVFKSSILGGDGNQEYIFYIKK